MHYSYILIKKKVKNLKSVFEEKFNIKNELGYYKADEDDNNCYSKSVVFLPP